MIKACHPTFFRSRHRHHMSSNGVHHHFVGNRTIVPVSAVQSVRISFSAEVSSSESFVLQSSSKGADVHEHSCIH